MGKEFETDEYFMHRAIALGRLGAGNTAPNPMVGAVIVHNGRIIGEGYHREYGKEHAEVNAIRSVKNRELLSESSIYVTLEPCSHFGKTPPCADLLIREKIPHVIAGVADPYAGVAGKGIAKLRNAGCRVDLGILEDECKELNKRFFTFHQQKRPYIFLKWAQTEDGFIDIDRTAERFGRPTWITNDLCRTAVHKMRAEESAILVGTNTVQKDNPSLTVRMWSGKNPLRIVMDRNLRLAGDSELFSQKTPTLVFTSKNAASVTNIEYERIEFNGDEIEQMLASLHRRGLLSLIVEGGAEMLNSFIKKSLWDEAHIYVGHKLFQKGIPAPRITGRRISEDELDDAGLLVFLNQDQTTYDN